MYPSDWFLHTEIQRRYLCEHWRHLAAVRRTKEAAAVDELMSEGEPLLLNEGLCTEQPAQMVQRKQHRCALNSQPRWYNANSTAVHRTASPDGTTQTAPLCTEQPAQMVQRKQHRCAQNSQPRWYNANSTAVHRTASPDGTTQTAPLTGRHFTGSDSTNYDATTIIRTPTNNGITAAVCLMLPHRLT